MKKLLYIIFSGSMFYTEASELAEINRDIEHIQPKTEISGNFNEKMAIPKKEAASISEPNLTNTIFRKLTDPELVEEKNTVMVSVQDYVKTADNSITEINKPYKRELSIANKEFLRFDHHLPYLEFEKPLSMFDGYSSATYKIHAITDDIENANTKEFIVTTGIFKHKLHVLKNTDREDKYTISINFNNSEKIIGKMHISYFPVHYSIEELASIIQTLTKRENIYYSACNNVKYQVCGKAVRIYFKFPFFYSYLDDREVIDIKYLMDNL